eukprot:TRINITY_DN7082_c0_g1_i1.p1 TRINITY_DN7082_c0_g1~~TRINITY_DN7082_c0_g1_i1.p1  ORF type:complete len:345 (-),score=106.89 TRINITY_DN7082_c0_g1_i1:171-1205(-)
MCIRDRYETTNGSIDGMHRLGREEVGSKLHHVLGVAQDEIQKLSRFDRLALLRRINYWEHNRSEDPANKSGTKKSTDRDARWTIAKQAEMHRFENELSFQKQMEKILSLNPEFSSDDESDEQEDEIDYEDLAGNLEEALEAESKKTKKKRKVAVTTEEHKQLSALVEQAQNQGPVEAPTLLESARPAIPAVGGAIQRKNGKRRRVLILKKTIRSDPTTNRLRTLYEYITDPQEVDKQLKRDAKSRATRARMGAEEHIKMTDERREKRRLQEYKRRLEKRRAVEASGGYPSARNNARKIDNPSRQSMCTSRCSACGAIGHMKTNRKCPKYLLSCLLYTSPSPRDS